jgi:hypothetical protein
MFDTKCGVICWSDDWCCFKVPQHNGTTGTPGTGLATPLHDHPPHGPGGGGAPPQQPYIQGLEPPHEHRDAPQASWEAALALLPDPEYDNKREVFEAMTTISLISHKAPNPVRCIVQRKKPNNKFLKHVGRRGPIRQPHTQSTHHGFLWDDMHYDLVSFMSMHDAS